MFLLDNIYLPNSWQFLKIRFTNIILILSSYIPDYCHLTNKDLFDLSYIYPYKYEIYG